MRSTLIRFLLLIICCLLPVASSAATNRSIHVEWGYTPPSVPAVTGFKLYQEGVFACQTKVPKATAMDCTVSLTADSTLFTMTATFSDGTESPHSSPFAFSLPKAATIAINPISVSSSALAAGLTNTATTPVTVNSPSSAAGLTNTATAPMAVISSSLAAGPIPLTVTFGGSSSKASTNASITSYSWNFGDGSSTTGANTTHTFTTAGSYKTTLTVTDSKGLTKSASTPIVVTAAAAAANTLPTAVASVTPLSGIAPLAVTFDGSGSSDANGSITSYVWNFGDGSSATGKTATHTYTTASTFTATLQVTDNQGAKSTANKTITVGAQQPSTALKVETGEIAVTSNWARVSLASSFTNPVVVAGPPKFNNSDPCVIRIRNVDKTGFDIKLTEWNSHDGVHPAETISYLVMEKGRIILPDGSIVEAGSFTGTTSLATVSFSKSFAKIPVVITTIASVNEPDTISGRIKNIGLANFAYYFSEQGVNSNIHANETVNFIAWEPGKGTVGSVQFEATVTGKGVASAWYQQIFQTPFKQSPLLLADIQTINDPDTSTLRMQQVTSTGFQMKVEEQQSIVTHPAETVGYLALSLTAVPNYLTSASQTSLVK